MFQPGGSIRAVLFDAVGTLIRPEPAVGAAYLAAARRFGMAGDLVEEEVSRRFRAAFARQEAIDHTADWHTDESRERRRWECIVAEVFGDASTWQVQGQALFESLWNHFADAKNWAVIEAARQEIDAARDAGLIVGVASNFDARLHRLLDAMPQLGITGNVFVSSELGHRKPGREFFRAIENELGLAPEELLLIGDDVDNDDKAARAAGWQSLLVSRD
jgi:putative hydrolase of the HAD superfamily